MKRLIAALLAVVVLIGLCACSDTQPSTPTNGHNVTPTNTPDACSHKYEAAVTKAATCTEAGETTYTCSACGDSYTEQINALDHELADGKCTRCGLMQYSPIEEGVWSYSSPNGNDFYSEVTFRNGTFVHVEKIDNGDHIKTYTGTYTIEGDTITLVYENAKGAIINLRRAYEDTLVDDTDQGLPIFGHTLNLHKQ